MLHQVEHRRAVHDGSLIEKHQIFFGCQLTQLIVRPGDRPLVCSYHMAAAGKGALDMVDGRLAGPDVQRCQFADHIVISRPYHLKICSITKSGGIMPEMSGCHHISAGLVKVYAAVIYNRSFGSGSNGRDDNATAIFSIDFLLLIAKQSGKCLACIAKAQHCKSYILHVYSPAPVSCSSLTAVPRLIVAFSSSCTILLILTSLSAGILLSMARLALYRISSISVWMPDILLRTFWTSSSSAPFFTASVMLTTLMSPMFSSNSEFPSTTTGSYPSLSCISFPKSFLDCSSPCTRNTCDGLCWKAASHANRPFWSACPENPSRL